MRSFLTLILVAAAAAIPTAAWADTHPPGFQLQADGLFYGPVGKLASQSHASLSDLFGTGGGFAITASIGLTTHWSTGVRAASLRGSAVGEFEFVDMGTPVGSLRPTGAGPYDLERELKLLPVLAIVQYRRALGPKAEWSADAGAGVLSTVDHLTLRSRSSGELLSISAYQKDPAWSLATSVAWLVPGNLDVVGSARFIGTLTSTGAAWAKGDDPGFASFSLGLRYPHDTQ